MGKCNEMISDCLKFNDSEDVHEGSNISCKFCRKVCTGNILFTSIIATVCIVDIIITDTIKLQE